MNILNTRLNNNIEVLFKCHQQIPPKVSPKALKEAKRGQGLTSTRWKGVTALFLKDLTNLFNKE
jgi:hypothetical protein